MTNTKTTKKALVASVISILLCATMLVGTTYAWFTDTATTGVNTIVAGNLDIKLSYKNANDTDYAEVSATTTDLFVNKDGSAMLWEPGAVSVCYFKLENLGTLALQYKLSVSYKDTVTYTDSEGNVVKLSDALKSAVVELSANETLDRAVAVEAAEAEAVEALGHMSDATTMLAGADARYFALVIYMPTTIDNKYNLPTGADALEIELGINLVATQVSAENDGFGNDYDAGAEWPVVMAASGESVVDALKQTQDTMIVLACDVTLSDVTNIEGNKVIDLNGNTLTVTEQKGVTVPENATLTIDNGTIAYTGDDFAPIYVQSNSVVNIEDGAVFDITSAAVAGQWSMAAAVYVNSGSDSVVNINGGIINVTGDNAVGVYAHYTGGGNHTINLNGGVINVEGEGAIAMDVVSKNTINLNGGVINVKGEGAYAFNVGQSQGQPTVVTGNGKTVVNLYEGTKLSDDEDAAQFEGVAMTVNQAKVLKPNPEKPEEVKEQLDNIIKDNDSALVELPKGDYTLPSVSDKDVTIVGDKDTVIDTTAGMPGSTGAALTFEGITINFKEGGSYGTNGFTHAKKVVYKDCIINGTQFLYASEGTEFINCTFNVEGDAYSVWTYGTNATFTGCTFNTSGKAILVYTEGTVTATVTVNDCIFNDDNAVTEKDGANLKKAAIEIGESANGNQANYTVNIKNCTVNGFDVTGQNASIFGGTDLGTKVWGNKNLMPADRLHVFVDGTEVY